MIDAVFEDGDTINFYLMNVPPPNKWIEKGNSPTHSENIFVVDTLPDQYYTFGMDNIFISENSLQVEYTKTKSKTMVHGVCGQNVL